LRKEKAEEDVREEMKIREDIERENALVK